MRKWLIATFGIFLLSALAVGLVVHTNRTNTTYVFFSGSLQSAGITETVSVLDTTYHIERGVIVEPSEQPLSVYKKLKIVTRAYAVATARHNPIFGIAGTDPKALFVAVEELSRTQKEFADAQTHAPDTTAVASALYPIRFLSSLAHLEESRLRFIKSGSDTDFARYQRSLETTLNAAAKDINTFEVIMDEVTERNARPIVGFGGTMATTSIHQEIASIRTSISKNRARFVERRVCIVESRFPSCDPASELYIPVPNPLPTTPNGVSEQRVLPALTKEIESLFSEANGRPKYADDTFVTLDSSVCLAATPGPHDFLIWRRSPDGRTTFDIKYRGDLFLYETRAGQTENMTTYAFAQGISFFHLNPTMYYMCPEIQADRGTAYAITETARFAKAHPHIAPQEQERIVRDLFHLEEADAINYLRAAVLGASADTSTEERRVLAHLALLFNERSAGLEYLVSDMVDIHRTDLRLRAKGAPIDLQSDTLFLTHTAFPSLFLAHQPTEGDTGTRLRTQQYDDQRRLFSRIKRYSDLRLSVPHEKIVADIHAFLKMEGMLFSQMENEKKAVPNDAGSICGDSIDLKCLKDRFIEEVKDFFEWNQYAKLEKCGVLLDLKCSKDVIVDVISENGLEAGFRLIKKLYEENPSFRPLCHKFSMGVGAALYQKFPDYTGLSYTPLSVTCNYGFYQEYPHSLLLATGDIKKAKEFCEYVGKELGRSVPAAEEECFRGIGRGLPFIDKSSAGDARRMAKFATSACKDISPNENDYSNCLSGAFNMLARETVAKNYGLSVNESDPLWLCREQPKEIQRQCYANFKWTDVPKVDEKNDVLSAFKSTIDKYGESSAETARAIIWTIGYLKGLESTAGNISYDNFIKSCSVLDLPFKEQCVWGFSVGLAKHSFPGRQHEAVIDFCQKVQANEVLKTSDCASQAIVYLRGFYSPDQSKKMCAEFKRKLGVDCPLI